MRLTEALRVAAEHKGKIITFWHTDNNNVIVFRSARIQTLARKLYFEDGWDELENDENWEYDDNKGVIRKKNCPECEMIVD